MGSPEQNRLNAYLDTVHRLEPDIAPIDAASYYASAAISLKRIADVLERMEPNNRELVTVLQALRP